MTQEEGIFARALVEHVTFLPASFDKRFARSMHMQFVTNPDKPLTDKQRALLLAMIVRYRRQLPPAYVMAAKRQQESVA